MEPSSLDLTNLLDRAREGDRAAVNTLLDFHRDRLRRLVELRLDERVRGRVDASDVVQEIQLDVYASLEDFFHRGTLSFALWLRLRAYQHLTDIHRRHLGKQCRDARRERVLPGGDSPAASSSEMAAALVANQTSPSQEAVRAERVRRVQDALEELDPIDREVLTLRHFEMLTIRETAEIIGISESATAKRHIRAMERLASVLAAANTPTDF